MTDFVILAFRYFQKRLPLLYLLMTASFVGFCLLGYRLEYEEDISKLLPSANEAKAEGLAFSELRVKDKIFVQLLPRAGANVDADTLIAADEMFVELLLSYDKDGDVADVLYAVDDDFGQNILSYALEHVPLFVNDAFYGKMDSAITPGNIEYQMEENYRTLLSPEGLVLYRVMRYDPLNMRGLLLSGNGLDGAFGGGYTIYGNHFFTPDTSTAIVFVTPHFVSFDSKAGVRLVGKIEKVLGEVEQKYRDIEVLFHGAPVQSVFNSRQIKKDLALTMGLSLLFACLLIMFCFRNKSTLPMLLLPVVYGSVFAMACMYLIQGRMSLMALGIGAVVLGVALSYCLHVLTHYKYVGEPETVLHDQTKPVILGSLTTIGAFMGLMFTKSALLRDFGLFASFALVGTTIASLFFLPHFFKMVRNRRSEKAFHVLEKLNSYPLERKKWLIAFVAVLFLVSLFVTSKKVKFDSNLRNIGYFESKVMRSANWLAQKTVKGLSTTYFAATSNCLDSALIVNKKIEAVCDSLQQMGIIGNYAKSAILFQPEDYQRKRIAAWKDYWTSEKQAYLKDEIVQAGLKHKFKPEMFEPFFEMISKDYASSSLYEAGVLPENLMANVVEKTQGMYLVYTAVHCRSENVKDVSGLLAGIRNVIVADPFYYTSNMVEVMHDDFNTVLGISSIFVLIVLLLSFRSLPIALIAFLPMTVSWYIVLGVMGMFGLQFNLINIVISTFIFGIGVDYSIFVMEGLLAGGIPHNENRLLMYHKTAILLSAIVLILGIASLMFATHPAVSSIGVATLIGMTSTLLITYTVEPFLFGLLMKTPFGNMLRRQQKRC